MLTVKLQVIDESGQVLVDVSGPVQIPLQWKASANQPLVSLRGDDNGAFKVWALTVTPTAVLEMGYGKLLPNITRMF